MHPKVAIIYNQPGPCRYSAIGEEKAMLGVLDEVAAVHKALVKLGYPVTLVPLLTPLEQARAKLETLEADLVFNLFEGFDGAPETEALVADVLSEQGIPYTGCPGIALALSLDKAKTKALLKASGIDTPSYQVLSSQTLSMFQLGYPCIVKPCGEDASHGLSEKSVVNNFASLKERVTLVNTFFGGKALVEEFVEGRELNATVLGSRELTVLPISEIVYSLPPPMPRVLTFAAKWEPDSVYFQCTKAVCPAKIEEDEIQRIAKTAKAVFRLVGCRGYARVDMRLDTKGRLHVLEVNPNPDISPDSGAARQAEAAGMTYEQFIEQIVVFALEGDGG